MNTNKKTILIIGGAGYIGVELAKDLIKNGFNIHCFDNLIYRQKIPKIDKKTLNSLKEICVTKKIIKVSLKLVMKLS